MTNTNDFRQYAYQYDPSTLIAGFDVRRGSAAPNIKSTPQTTRRITLTENPTRKSKKELVHEQQKARQQVRNIVVVASICFILIAAVITSLAIKNDATRNLAREQNNLSNAISEEVCLHTQIDSMVSIGMIDEYANQMGMTKVKSNQIQYMDVGEYKAEHSAQLAKQGNIKK